MPYWNDDSIRAHMMALTAFRAFEGMDDPPKCDRCPFGHAWCGKGCPGEPPEDLRDLQAPGGPLEGRVPDMV